MAQDQAEPNGPDLVQGIALAQLTDGGKLVGHAGDEQVLLVRRGTQVLAVGAHCTHYHGPLVDGLVVGDTVRCPWHHACFDLRTGEAVHAPALSALASWTVEQRDGKIFVRDRRAQPQPRLRGKPAGAAPEKIVVVVVGAAGFAAVEMLRREQYQGSIVMLSNDDAPPVDRPNLSKELKNSRVGIGEGIRQCLSNQQEMFHAWFFSTVQLIFAGNDSEGLQYGTIGTQEKYFLKWKEDETDNSRFKLDKYLLKMCGKRRLIELMHDFVDARGNRRQHRN